MKRKTFYLKSLLLLALMAVGVGNAWAEDYKTVAKFESATVVTASSYVKYSNDNWTLTFGGNSKSMGTNKNNASKCKITTNYGTSASTSNIATAAVSNIALANVSRITFVYTGGSGNTGKMYLAYSTDNTNWSPITLTSGTQGSDVPETSNKVTFDFAEIASAYYAIILDKGNATAENFRFDDVAIEFLKKDAASKTAVATIGDLNVEDLYYGATGTFNPEITPADGLSSSDYTVTWDEIDEDQLLLTDNGEYVAGNTAGSVDVKVTVAPIAAKADDYESVSKTFTVTVKDSNAFTYDFSKIDGLSKWGTSYSEHEVAYTEATVTFAAASKQTNTITDVPVTKGNAVSLVLNGTGCTLGSVAFVCKQWGTKAQTITLKYSTDGGKNYNTLNPSVTSSDFTISSDNLPAGTNAVQITFNNTSNQVGIASVTFSLNGNVAITEAGYATFASNFALDLSNVSGLTAYTAFVSDNVVTFNKVTGTVPAGTGLLLKGEGNYDIPVVASSSTDVSGNALVGKTEVTTIGMKTGDNYNYVLKNGANGVGFYQVQNDSYKVRANSAYLAIPYSAADAGAKLFIGLDNATGIELTGAVKSSEQMFNLAGQRVGNDYKGIVIVNGKKVLK